MSDTNKTDGEERLESPEGAETSPADSPETPSAEAEAVQAAEPEAPPPAGEPVPEAPSAESAPSESQPEPEPVAAEAIAAVTPRAAGHDDDLPLNGPPRSRAKPKKPQNETVEIIKTVAIALAIALVVRVLFLQPFTIPSASMEPNLYEGDYIVVSKWDYGYSRHSMPWSPALFEGRILGSGPQRGDIVVFKLPSDNRTDYIKRVVGLPGDRIQVIGGRLHVNGQAVESREVGREQVSGPFGPMTALQVEETLPEGRTFLTQDFGPGFDLDDTQVFEVPQGYYFMMGDNRDNSIDSRADVGLVPAENLVGKARIVLFSWTPGASLWNPVSWFANLRPSRFFNGLT